MKAEDFEKTELEQEDFDINSEEIQEIVTAVPSWILKRGTALIFLILLSIVLASAFIEYPDIIKTAVKINSLNAPKAIYVKQTGKIVSLLIKEGAKVNSNDPLGYMESTGNHSDILKLHKALTQINLRLSVGTDIKQTITPGLNLGELQGVYQTFYQQYLQYISAQTGGYYLNRKKYLEKDLDEVTKMKIHINEQKKIQEKEFANIEDEFEAYKKLYQKGVVSTSEYKQQENKYFAGKYPLQQTSADLLNNNTNYAAKQKEILDIEHTIQDEKAKFVQSLSNMITEIDAWINQHILIASVAGKVTYAGIVQENQTVNAGQEIFIINPENTDFFGEVQIPQYNMGKVRNGQRVLLKMRSYPFEQYGLIRGKINYISDVAFKDSVFIAKISFTKFENKDSNHKIILKNGMQGDAEIVTEESSLLQRFLRGINKMLNNK